MAVFNTFCNALLRHCFVYATKSGIFQYRTALGKPQFQLDIMNQRVNHLLMNLLGPV